MRATLVVKVSPASTSHFILRAQGRHPLAHDRLAHHHIQQQLHHQPTTGKHARSKLLLGVTNSQADLDTHSFIQQLAI